MRLGITLEVAGPNDGARETKPLVRSDAVMSFSEGSVAFQR